MSRTLKSATISTAAQANTSQVRATVEAILADIGQRGDAALKEYSKRFDAWAPGSFRLTQADIDACIAQLTPQNISDIQFAQTQVRNFAQAQRDSMLDIEVETLPGVVLGHRNIPVQTVGCYVPSCRIPDDHKDALQTNADAKRTSLSWLSSVFCS